MNVLCEMKKMFNVDTMNISERNTVVEISFNLSKATLPDKETFSCPNSHKRYNENCSYHR